MSVIIDLTNGDEAVGDETTFFGGTIFVGEASRCIDGMTDRDGDYAWLGFVIDQLEIQLGILGDTEKYVERLNGELNLGHKYEASLVDGELVVTEVKPPTAFVYSNLETNEENSDGVALTLYFDDLPTKLEVVQTIEDRKLPVDTKDQFFNFLVRPTPVSEKAGLVRVQCHPTC
jgi:hypothetical protein